MHKSGNLSNIRVSIRRTGKVAVRVFNHVVHMRINKTLVKLASQHIETCDNLDAIERRIDDALARAGYCVYEAPGKKPILLSIPRWKD